MSEEQNIADRAKKNKLWADLPKDSNVPKQDSYVVSIEGGDTALYGGSGFNVRKPKLEKR